MGEQDTFFAGDREYSVNDEVTVHGEYIWNDQGGLHPHLHIIPRFDDEPMAGHGVRSGIKDPANRRPDPWRPGTGRHLAGS